MANVWTRVRKAWAALDARDALVGLGLLLIAIGCWSIFPPASFVVPGSVLVWYGLPSRPAFIEKKGGR